MIALDTPLTTLQAFTESAVTGSVPTAEVVYRIAPQATRGSTEEFIRRTQTTELTGTTPVNITPSPAINEVILIDYINLVNNSDTTNTVTVRKHCEAGECTDELNSNLYSKELPVSAGIYYNVNRGWYPESPDSLTTGGATVVDLTNDFTLPGQN